MPWIKVAIRFRILVSFPVFFTFAMTTKSALSNCLKLKDCLFNTTVFRELFEYNWTLNVVFSIALYHRGTVLWMEQNLLPLYLMPPALVSSLCVLVLFRVRTVLNSWNLPSNFPDLKKVLKIEVKSGKLVTSLEFFSFFQSYNKCFISEFFPRGQIVFNVARIEDI